MPNLRIGIDVGGTFTHGVILRPPGEVVATARVPTTHTAASGVAEGVRQVLAELLQHADAADIELVAHSTTQATNALLEGDVAPVILAAVVPPGEGFAVRQALPAGKLDLGGGHCVELTRVLIPWEDVVEFEPSSGSGVSAHDSVAQASLLASDVAGKLEACPTKMVRTAARPTANMPGSGGLSAAALDAGEAAHRPVAVVQPLAGKHELREELVAAKYRALGHPVVCAADITQVLGLSARARTAVVNASMLPKMLATARFTAQAVAELLPGVPVQVVRSDGGAMSLAEMQRLPVLSLLSGPAAGASAALARSGLSNVVFIEVGGTSTDITLIKDGRVRHRYATVGGQRLLVPALDLRTVAVGGGSMLRADAALFGPRSAHIAGLPYLFQALQNGLEAVDAGTWTDSQNGTPYVVAKMSDGSLAAFTMTDFALSKTPGSGTARGFGFDLETTLLRKCKQWMFSCGQHLRYTVPERKVPARIRRAAVEAGFEAPAPVSEAEREQHQAVQAVLDGLKKIAKAYFNTCDITEEAIKELAAAHHADLADFKLRIGGGGGPAIDRSIAVQAGMQTDFRERAARDSSMIAGFFNPQSSERGNSAMSQALASGLEPNFDAMLIPDHAVISAIGAALAVSCVSLSKSVAEPSTGDIAELTAEVERRLSAQGAERVSTDYEFDSQRQVLTVTGRGSQPYAQDAQVRTPEELHEIANRLVSGEVSKAWQSDQLSLWQSDASGERPYAPGNMRSTKHEKRTINAFFKKLISKPVQNQQAVLLNHYGQCLWQGVLREFWPVAGNERETVLKQILELRTQYTDGGPVLPGLALACAGRLIPLDQLASADLIAEVLRWEQLPPDADGCFLLRG